MALIVELGVGILAFLAELSVLVALGLALPVRFACSPSFRKKKSEEWASYPKRKLSDIVAAVVAVAGIAICVYWWIAILGDKSAS